MTDHNKIRHVILLKPLSMPSPGILSSHPLGLPYPNDQVILFFPLNPLVWKGNDYQRTCQEAERRQDKERLIAHTA